MAKLVGSATKNVIEKVKIACQKSGWFTDDHFVVVNKMVMLSSEGVREVTDMVLSRYVCCLIAQSVVRVRSLLYLL